MNQESEQPMKDPNPAQPEIVPPQPVPFSMATARIPAATPEGFAVVLTTFTPTGQHVVFMPPANARQLAKELMEHATGLSLPDLTVPGLVN